MKLINFNKRFAVVDANSDELAAQLTLIDLPIFKSIKTKELYSLASKHHRNACPNIVALERQFNQVTFWVVGQILAYDTPRHRADVVSQFIKTAKRLYQLNNLHSANAVASALLSSPIYRLDRTWHFVRRKHPREKAQLDRLQELFSDNNNYELLRNHLNTCKLPCIPYLGMYSRDIIYINEAHREGSLQRMKGMSQIVDSIETFQSSEYEKLVNVPNIFSCFMSNRYIEELQKFVEDENYNRSLELEPPSNLRLLSVK